MATHYNSLITYHSILTIVILDRVGCRIKHYLIENIVYIFELHYAQALKYIHVHWTIGGIFEINISLKSLKSLRSVHISILELKNYPRISKI